MKSKTATDPHQLTFKNNLIKYSSLNACDINKQSSLSLNIRTSLVKSL